MAITLKGRLRVTAAEGLRAAVLANVGLAVVSEWMFAPEIDDGTVKVVLKEWQLPRIDLWAVFPTGRTATAKARTFAEFVRGSCVFPAEQIRRHCDLASPSDVRKWANATDIVLGTGCRRPGVLRKWFALSGIAKQHERGSGLPNIV
jgi:LysR substrate binding domain